MARDAHRSSPPTTGSPACTAGSCRTRTRRPRAVLPRLPLRAEPRVQRLDAGASSRFEVDALLERQLCDARAAVGGVPVRRRHRHERGSGVVAPGPPRGPRIVLRARGSRLPLAHVLRRRLRCGGSSTRAPRPSARTSTSAESRRRSGKQAPATRKARSTWLWRPEQRRWIPYAAVYELAKFAGLQLGRRHRVLPAALKRRLSAYPDYWTS